MRVIIVTYLLLGLFGCTSHSEMKEEKEFHIEVDKYFTNNFLKNWNEASLNYLVNLEALNKENQEIDFLKYHYKYDSLSSKGATRGAFVKALNESSFLDDTIYFRSIYIIELSFSGEHNFKRKYLIINKNLASLYFNFKSTLGKWELERKGVANIQSIEELENLLNSRPALITKEYDSETFVVTKITPNEIKSKVVINPNEKDLALISNYIKKLNK